jgi:AraC-type transcriptional regulator
MSDRFRVLSVMARQLEGMGIPTNAVLRLAGLPIQLFQQTRIWLTTEEMRALYDAIAQVSGDPAIGLRLGSEERPENYSPIAIAALFTRSFRDALNRVARYKRLTSPQEIRLSERGRECAVEFVWLLTEVMESPIWID